MEIRKLAPMLLLVVVCNLIFLLKSCCEASERQRLHTSEYESSSANDGKVVYLSYQDAAELLSWDGQEELLQGQSSNPSTLTFSAATQTEPENLSLQASSLSQDASLEKSPFIICNAKSNYTGYSRRTQVCSWLKINEEECAAAPILINTVDKTCSIFQSSTDAVAYASGNAGLTSLPLDPTLKMRKGLLDAINNGNATQFYVDLCDKHSSAERVYHKLNNQLWNNGTNLRMRALLSAIHFKKNNKHNELDGEKRHLRSGPEGDNGISKRMSAFRRSLEVLYSNECSNVYKGLNLTSAGSSSLTIQFNISSMSNSSFMSLCILNIVQLLAADNEVCSINYVRNIGLSATAEALIGPNNINWIAQSDSRSFRPWFQAGLTGVGQIVGLSDSGIDTDNCYLANGDGNDVTKDGGIYPSNRKVIQYYPNVDGLDGTGGHGTSVAATIVGKRLSAQGVADGIAPDAKIAFFDIGNDSDPDKSTCCSIPSDFSIFLSKARSAGAKIQNISWGTMANNNYINMDRMLDDFIYNDQDSIIVVAAGNNGPGANTVVSPALAKNVITVGAHHSALQDLFQGQLGRNFLAFFSAEGPTADGRLKPDVVAPGLSVLTARALPLRTGECDPTIQLTPGQAMDGVGYRYGTSFAAPIVSGLAALIRQYFMDGFYPSGSKISSSSFLPSGQLIKAVILNGAQPLSGSQSYDANYGFQNPVSLPSGSAGYDNHQGYGRAILQTSLPLSNSGLRMKAIAFDRVIIQDNQVHTTFITIDSTNCDATSFSVTISWADPPALDGCQTCNINDIDLIVYRQFGDYGTFYGNGGSGKDGINNVERVRISNVSNGSYKVVVTASNLAISPQYYSIIMTGCPIYKLRTGYNYQSLCPCPPDTTCSYICPKPG